MRIATDVALDVGLVRRWIEALAAAVETGCDDLTRLDAAIGDADHGVNMTRGMRAAVATFDGDDVPDLPGPMLTLVGNRLVSVVGGAAGPLYGSAFRAMGAAIGGSTGDLEVVSGAVRAGLEAVQRLGAAEAGDKTMVDAWMPAALALEAGGRVVDAVEMAEKAAREGMMATIPMRAHKGRASYLGWRSEGHQDPGATSTHMVFASLLIAAT